MYYYYKGDTDNNDNAADKEQRQVSICLRAYDINIAYIKNGWKMKLKKCNVHKMLISRSK